MKSEKTRRIAYWDNAKAILIFLVVLGHFLLPAVSDHGVLVKAVYFWIYLFHMPAFVFVSGYFSKRYVQKGGNDIKKLIGFLVLYALYCSPNWIISALHRDPILIFTPTGAQWYLLCMFLWYVLIPHCAKIKPAPMLFISVIVALLIGMDSGAGDFLAISRCIVFFPFFLIGFYFDSVEHAGIRKKLIAVSILGFALACTFLFTDFFDQHSSTLYGASAYAEILTGAASRFIWYVIAYILVVALLCIIPHKQLPFTYIGQRTLAIYILHRPIRGVLRIFGLYSHLNSDIQVLTVCIVISVILTVILSTKTITNLLDNIFEFDYKILIKSST